MSKLRYIPGEYMTQSEFKAGNRAEQGVIAAADKRLIKAFTYIGAGVLALATVGHIFELKGLWWLGEGAICTLLALLGLAYYFAQGFMRGAVSDMEFQHREWYIGALELTEEERKARLVQLEREREADRKNVLTYELDYTEEEQAALRLWWDAAERTGVTTVRNHEGE